MAGEIEIEQPLQRGAGRGLGDVAKVAQSDGHGDVLAKIDSGILVGHGRIHPLCEKRTRPHNLHARFEGRYRAAGLRKL